MAHPRVEIEYCTQCRWLLRAGWMAQELLTTFPAELGEVALVPGSGGGFEFRVEGETVWFIVYQQLENHLLQPIVYGRTVQLSPLAILISVLIGAEVAGVIGALGAIPVAGTIQIVLVDWIEHRRARAADGDDGEPRYDLPAGDAVSQAPAP